MAPPRTTLEQWITGDPTRGALGGIRGEWSQIFERREMEVRPMRMGSPLEEGQYWPNGRQDRRKNRGAH